MNSFSTKCDWCRKPEDVVGTTYSDGFIIACKSCWKELDKEHPKDCGDCGYRQGHHEKCMTNQPKGVVNECVFTRKDMHEAFRQTNQPKTE